MKYLSFVVFGYVFISCKSEVKQIKENTLTANAIINSSINVSGGDGYGDAIITFSFRDIDYNAKRTQGTYELSRFRVIDSDTIVDLITNNGFTRFMNGNRVKVEDSMAVNYAASVNSVHYFSIIPYVLNDKAVNKRLIGEERIKNETYYKIKVTFNEEDGGEDFEDVFIYWINQTTYKPDYLAYSYIENTVKGMRFREAYNERYFNGLRFVDYHNYKPADSLVALKDLAKIFEKKQLKVVSKIELKDIVVNPIGAK